MPLILNEAIEYERGNLKVKTRTVRIIPPPSYTREEIKGFRNQFKFSQRVFAEVLGVSPKTVEAWEAGRNHPDGSSSRMLQLLQKDPDLIQREGLIAIE
jgi:putative transcriptional regulator